MTKTAQMTTSWIWLNGDAVRGLSVDRETAVMRWSDQIGCHCTDEDGQRQSVEQFRREGVPSMYQPVPDDVGSELDALLALI